MSETKGRLLWHAFSLPNEGWPSITLILLTLTAIYLIQWFVQRKRFIDAVNKLPGPPMSGPTWRPWFAHFGPLVETIGSIPGHPELPDSISFFLNLCKDYADYGLFRIWAFNPYRFHFARTSITVFDPDLCRQLLENRDNSRNLHKEPRIFGIAAPVVGSSLLSLNDTPEWKHQRKMAAPSFHANVLEQANQIAAQLLDEICFPYWDRHGAVGVEALEWSTRLTVEVLGRVAFSYSFGGLNVYNEGKIASDESEDSLFDTYQTLLYTITKRFRSPPLVQYLHNSENARFREASKRLDSVVSDVVRERLEVQIQEEQDSPLKTKSVGSDLLSQLLIKDEDGYRLPFEYIFGNIRMFMFAGHDTTANTLAYALWDLASNPDAQTKLRKEVDGLFEGLAEGEIPTCKQLMQLKYLDAVVREVLRLHAPAGIARRAAEDITLTKGAETFTIPKNSSIYIFPMYMQVCEKYWDRPEEFDPDRFLSGNVNMNAYFPFSVGPRNCLGLPLANAELKTVIAHVVRNYVIRPNSEATEPIPIVLLTVKPSGVLLDFERRKDVR